MGSFTFQQFFKVIDEEFPQWWPFGSFEGIDKLLDFC